jgi:hypothetical protein
MERSGSIAGQRRALFSMRLPATNDVDCTVMANRKKSTATSNITDSAPEAISVGEVAEQVATAAQGVARVAKAAVGAAKSVIGKRAKKAKKVVATAKKVAKKAKTKTKKAPKRASKKRSAKK